MPPLTLDGTTGVSAVQAGAVESGDLASGAIGSGDLPAGSVIQVVSVTKNDVFSTGSNNYVDVTGLAASITPSNATNKVLIFLRTSQAMSSDNRIFTTLLRNSTTISAASGFDYFSSFYPSRSSGGVLIYVPHGSTHLDFLDSPNTTSSVTYKVQMKVGAGVGYLNRSRDDDALRGVSSITLMEIAG